MKLWHLQLGKGNNINVQYEGKLKLKQDVVPQPGINHCFPVIRYKSQ